jgi:hypothetical protein
MPIQCQLCFSSRSRGADEPVPVLPSSSSRTHERPSRVAAVGRLGRVLRQQGATKAAASVDSGSMGTASPWEATMHMAAIGLTTP